MPDEAPNRPASARESAAAGGLVAIAMMVMNVLVYGYTLISTRLLEPAEYGGLGALLGLLITTSVGALALQATAARQLATAAAGERSARARLQLRAGTRVTAAVALPLLAVAPVIHLALDVSWPAALLVGATMIPLTMLGALTGLLQGAAVWRWLAGVFLAFGIGRLVVAGAVVAVWPSITGAMVGLALGACVPTLLAWWGVQRTMTPGSGPDTSRDRLPFAELWRNAHLLLAFFTLTNLDVLVARALFESTLSGLYAAGAILAKACLFLPQFVVIVAFPQMAREADGESADETDSASAGRRAWLTALALVAVIGSAIVLGTLVLRHAAVLFVGGAAYSGLSGFVWWFALEGTVFALLQMAVYRQIALQARGTVWWLWGAVFALLTAAATVELRPQSLLAGVVAVSVIALGALLRAGLRPRSTSTGARTEPRPV